MRAKIVFSIFVLVTLIACSIVVKHYYFNTAKEKITTEPEQINLWVSQLNEEKTKTEKEVYLLKKRLNEKKMDYNRYRKVNGDLPDSDRCQRLVNEANLITESLTQKKSFIERIDKQIDELKGVLSESETREMIAKMAENRDIISTIKNDLEVKKLTDNTGEKPFVNYQSAEDLDKLMAVPITVTTVPSSTASAPATITPTAPAPIRPPQTTRVVIGISFIILAITLGVVGGIILKHHYFAVAKEKVILNQFRLDSKQINLWISQLNGIKIKIEKDIYSRKKLFYEAESAFQKVSHLFAHSEELNQVVSIKKLTDKEIAILKQIDNQIDKFKSVLSNDDHCRQLIVTGEELILQRPMQATVPGTRYAGTITKENESHRLCLVFTEQNGIQICAEVTCPDIPKEKATFMGELPPMEGDSFEMKQKKGSGYPYSANDALRFFRDPDEPLHLRLSKTGLEGYKFGMFHKSTIRLQLDSK